MSATIITAATPADTAAIFALLERSQLPTAGLQEHLRTAFVARKGPEVVGSAALELYEGGALLRSVAVDDAQRGTGLGQRLTHVALESARQRGLRAVYLLTTTAQRFFPHFGF